MALAIRQRRRHLEALRRRNESRPPPARQSDPPPFADWSRRHLGHYFTLAPSPFHLWLHARLDRLRAERGTRLNVLAPRGGGKSVWSTQAYPLYAGLEGFEPYILLTSDTNDQAEQFLVAIRREVEENATLRAAYPRACRLLSSRQRSIVLGNGVRIDALGTGAKVRGRKNRQHRPSLVVVDDPQNKDHTISEVRRSRSWDWLTRDLMNVGSPVTNTIVLGTALHPDGIVNRLQKSAVWESRVWKSVVEWPADMTLWREWELILNDWDNPDAGKEALAFYGSNRAAMDAGAVVLWPEREPLLDLMTRRASEGHAAFESEKQNDPVDPESCEWPPELLDWPGLMFEKWPGKLELRVVSIDPSKGKDARHGDYSAIVKYGRAASGIEYVECDMARRPVDRICEDAAAICAEFRPDLLVLETNGFQELLSVPLRAALEKAGCEVHVKGMDNGVNKNVRIRRLTVPLTQRKLRFRARSPGTHKLLEQMRQFPNAANDDGPDGLEMARRAAIDLSRGGRP